MLVLSRSKGERIVINPGCENEITIVVLEWKNGQMRIGIDAPPYVLVMRGELCGTGYERPEGRGPDRA